MAFSINYGLYFVHNLIVPDCWTSIVQCLLDLLTKPFVVCFLIGNKTDGQCLVIRNAGQQNSYGIRYGQAELAKRFGRLRFQFIVDSYMQH